MAEADILSPSNRRRTWNAAEKVALLAEIDAERRQGPVGGTVVEHPGSKEDRQPGRASTTATSLPDRRSA